MNKTIYSAVLLAVLASTAQRTITAESWPLWQDGGARGRLVLPTDDERAARLAQATFARHLQEFYNVELPVGCVAAE